MTTVMFYVLGAVLGGGVVGGFGSVHRYRSTLNDKARAFKAQIERVKEIEEEMLEAARKKEEDMIANARKKEETIVEQSHKKAEEIIQKGEQKALRIEENAEKDVIRNQEKLDKIEQRLMEKEDKIDQRKVHVEELKQQAEQSIQTAQELVIQQQEKLSAIAELSRDDARTEIMDTVRAEQTTEISDFVAKSCLIKKEEADKEAMKILARVMPRLYAEAVVEFTVDLVDVPDESYKGKMIGREGRNIAFFEKVTGVEVVIDDTPGVIRVSSTDHEKRFKAVTTLKRLLKDGRINPFYIEKFYNETNENFDEIVLEKGKEALTMLNLPMMKPELVHYVGRFYFRYSYGQNLWQHSIEVAQICEGIAAEMGEDTVMAKKAGLLHDIGKVIAENGESHTIAGGDTLRKLGADPIIINAAESHHFDIDMTHTISWIVAAADGISASRPGARFNSKDRFIEKMAELERLISEVPGVNKVHIMQAGREIMVYADPAKIPDNQLQELIATIGKKIETKLDYPGVIRCVCFRENKMVQYLR